MFYENSDNNVEIYRAFWEFAKTKTLTAFQTLLGLKIINKKLHSVVETTSSRFLHFLRSFLKKIRNFAGLIVGAHLRVCPALNFYTGQTRRSAPTTI